MGEFSLVTVVRLLPAEDFFPAPSCGGCLCCGRKVAWSQLNVVMEGKKGIVLVLTFELGVLKDAAVRLALALALGGEVSLRGGERTEEGRNASRGELSPFIAGTITNSDPVPVLSLALCSPTSLLASLAVIHNIEHRYICTHTKTMQNNLNVLTMVSAAR